MMNCNSCPVPICSSILLHALAVGEKEFTPTLSGAYVNGQFHVSKNPVAHSPRSSEESIPNRAVVEDTCASHKALKFPNFEAIILKKSWSFELPRSSPAVSLTWAKLLWVCSKIEETLIWFPTKFRSHSGCSQVERRQRPMRQRDIWAYVNAEKPTYCAGVMVRKTSIQDLIAWSEVQRHSKRWFDETGKMS